MSRLKFLVPALLALGCATAPPAVTVRPDPKLTGTWTGAVSLPNGALQFLARVGEDGTGTVDVPQQNATGLALRVVRSDVVAFEMISDVPGAPAVLIGTREGDVLRGTFAQRGYEFPFELRREGTVPIAVAPILEGVAAPERLVGAWHGAVVLGAQHLPFDLVFDERATSGTFAVPTQGLRALKLEGVGFDGARLAFAVTLPNGQRGGFEGALKDGRIEGTFAQGGGTSPFFMERGERPVPAKAASETHEEHDVVFTNAELSLAGTLTLPRTVTRPPVAILISGSGPQDRNEEVAGFKVFEALAHELAKGGLATLRFDDRGVGRSTGDFHAATTEDFVADAEAAVRFLQSRTDVDTRRIGLMGHSEGAVVAPMLASRNGEVAFLVLLAPSAQNLGDLVVDQIAPASRAEGMPVELIESHQRMMRKAVALLRRATDKVVGRGLVPRRSPLHARERRGTSPLPTGSGRLCRDPALLREGKDLAPMEADLAAACAPACQPGDATVTGLRRRLETPWFRAFVRLDPAPFLAKVQVPVLALSAGLDVQVPGDKNLPLLRKIAADAKAGSFVVEEIPGMNHVLQTAKTGAVSEYATLPKQLEPKLTARILSWLPQAIPAR